ncbi:MAG: peptide ABC transporter substrate-binding protein [Anaerolineales bacterium]|nr:peptide ABC transporter substrate-binding protein [Anaerolineales bacterium]
MIVQSQKKAWSAFVLLMIAALLLTSCGGNATEETTSVPPTEEAQPVGESTIPRGGRAVIALIQEPGQLSQFFNVQTGSFLSNLAVEPLFIVDSNGNYQPLLASEVPTLENGGISPDNLTITYKLKPDILWSDGEPFTADDILFTFEVYKDPNSTTMAPPAYSYIESVTVIDPLTVEVRMSSINPEYLTLWQSVLPKHRFDSTAVTQEHPLALTPLGTGPFVITEWRTGDQIVFDRNPNYRDPDKPYLDGITVKITPDREATIAGFRAGQFDYIFFLAGGDLEAINASAEAGEIQLEMDGGGMQCEFLWFNMSNYGDISTPHPILGDPAIREAIDYGIDRQGLVDNILGGFGTLTGSFIYVGWAATDVPPTPYDPDHARAVLDEAGWVPGEDGIRVKEGVRASLRFQTIAGDVARELYQQLIQQNMRDIGIELNIENVPSNTLFGGYSEGGLIQVGDFDIVMSRDGYFLDPLEWVSYFTTSWIPNEESPDGWTYALWSNPEFDRLADEAAATIDLDARQALYNQIDEMFRENRLALPLYQAPRFNAWSNRLQGVEWDYFNPRHILYGTADWYIQP